MPCVLSRHMLRDWPMCNKAAEEGEGEETNTQRQGEKGQQAAASAPTPLAPEWTIAALSSPSHRFARLRLKVDEQPSDGAADSASMLLCCVKCWQISEPRPSGSELKPRNFSLPI